MEEATILDTVGIAGVAKQLWIKVGEESGWHFTSHCFKLIKGRYNGDAFAVHQ